MDRITISFQKETFDKLKENAEKKRILINQYVRNLVDIGFRVEEAASKNNGEIDKNSVSAKLDNIQNFIKKHLAASYENLYLTCHIVTNRLVPVFVYKKDISLPKPKFAISRKIKMYSNSYFLM